MATYDYQTIWPEDFNYENCGALGPETQCHMCKKHAKRFVDFENELWCKTCLTEVASECHLCKLYTVHAQVIEFEERTWCQDCIDEDGGAILCDSCEEYSDRDSGYYLEQSGDFWCKNCSDYCSKCDSAIYPDSDECPICSAEGRVRF